MEVEAALILFERSRSVNGLRYTTVICDGDSRSYNAIQQAKVYGVIPVEAECKSRAKENGDTASCCAEGQAWWWW